MSAAAVLPLWPRRHGRRYLMRRDADPSRYDRLLSLALTERQRLVAALFTDGHSMREVAGLVGGLTTRGVGGIMTDARHRARAAGLDPSVLYRRGS